MPFSVSLDQSYFMRAPGFPGVLPASADSPNELIRITMYPHWYSHVSLEWDIPDSWGDCSFNVFYTPNGVNTFTKLNLIPLRNPFFKDLTYREYSRFNDGNYVVEVILPNGRSVRSKQFSIQYTRRDRVNLMASEIQRREFMLLSKFAGVKSFLFKKRHYGKRCPRCWNPAHEKVMDDNCEVCYGTSWEGGFFDPIPLFLQYDVTPTSRLKGYHGDLEPNSIGAWTISLPEIHPDDVIIRSGDFAVYRVISLNSTELQAVPVRQILSITQMSRTNIENKLAKKAQYAESSEYLSEIGGRFVQSRMSSRLLDLNKNNDYPWAQDQNLINLPKAP